MHSERWDFVGSQGGLLAGRLDRPDSAPRAYALLAHCFTCGKDSLAAWRIAAQLAARGIATLRFDFTGLGDSEGEFANTGFSSNVEDIRIAIAALRERAKAPALLIGHSLGGNAVLAAAADAPEAKAVAVIGTPFAAGELLQKLEPQLADIERTGKAEISLGGRRFTIRHDFVEDLRREDPGLHLAGLGKALMILHAPGDRIVEIDNARLIFDAARHPKSFVALDGADHLLTRPGDASFVADILAAWLPRYLPAEAEAAQINEPHKVVVEETGAGRFQQRVRAGDHQFFADEPVDAGGLDSGPNPYDLLLAALGSCTAMTLRLYAERKGMALERVRVRLDHGKIHAEDCADCETREGMVDEITRDIEIKGALADAEHRRLMEIADRCPVHRTLTHEIKVRTRERRPAP